MKKCDKRKIHRSNKLHMTYIRVTSNNFIHSVTKNFTQQTSYDLYTSIF